MQQKKKNKLKHFEKDDIKPYLPCSHVTILIALPAAVLTTSIGKRPLDPGSTRALHR